MEITHNFVRNTVGPSIKFQPCCAKECDLSCLDSRQVQAALAVPQFLCLLLVTLAAYVVAILCCRSARFRLTNAGHWVFRDSYTRFRCRAFTEWPFDTSSKCNSTPLKFYYKNNMNFCSKRPCLITVSETWPERIHWSSSP